MSIRIGVGEHSHRLHRLARHNFQTWVDGVQVERDSRLGETVCGVLFVWGRVTGPRLPLPKCEGCW